MHGAERLLPTTYLRYLPMSLESIKGLLPSMQKHAEAGLPH